METNPLHVPQHQLIIKQRSASFKEKGAAWGGRRMAGERGIRADTYNYCFGGEGGGGVRLRA